MLLDLLSVFVLVVVGDSNVRTLASIVHGNGATNAGVSASDNSHLSAGQASAQARERSVSDMKPFQELDAHLALQLSSTLV